MSNVYSNNTTMTIVYSRVSGARRVTDIRIATDRSNSARFHSMRFLLYNGCFLFCRRDYAVELKKTQIVFHEPTNIRTNKLCKSGFLDGITPVHGHSLRDYKS